MQLGPTHLALCFASSNVEFSTPLPQDRLEELLGLDNRSICRYIDHSIHGYATCRNQGAVDTWPSLVRSQVTS